VALVGLLLAAAGLSRRWTARIGTVPAGPVETDETDEPVAMPETVSPERAAQLARQRAATDAARRRKSRDADPGRAGLRRSVLAETLVAAAVLAVTTALTGTDPGRNSGTAPPPAAGHRHDSGAVTIPFDTGGPHGKGTARLHVAPGRTGENTLHLTTTGPDGAPLDAPEVKVALTLPAGDIGPLSVTPRPVEGEKGHWRSNGVQLPLPGAWKAAVTVRTSDIDQVTEVRTLHIG
jgi:copper transport protein